jgi:hypothetical protein
MKVDSPNTEAKRILSELSILAAYYQIPFEKFSLNCARSTWPPHPHLSPFSLLKFLWISLTLENQNCSSISCCIKERFQEIKGNPEISEDLLRAFVQFKAKEQCEKEGKKNSYNLVVSFARLDHFTEETAVSPADFLEMASKSTTRKFVQLVFLETRRLYHERKLCFLTRLEKLGWPKELAILCSCYLLGMDVP